MHFFFQLTICQYRTQFCLEGKEANQNAGKLGVSRRKSNYCLRKRGRGLTRKLIHIHTHVSPLSFLIQCLLLQMLTALGPLSLSLTKSERNFLQWVRLFLLGDSTPAFPLWFFLQRSTFSGDKCIACGLLWVNLDFLIFFFHLVPRQTHTTYQRSPDCTALFILLDLFRVGR